MFCFTLSPKVYHTSINYVYVNFLLRNKQKKNGVKYRFLPLGGMDWKMSGQTGKWFERLLDKDEQGDTCKNTTYLSFFLLLCNTCFCWQYWCTLHVARHKFFDLLFLTLYLLGLVWFVSILNGRQFLYLLCYHTVSWTYCTTYSTIDIYLGSFLKRYIGLLGTKLFCLTLIRSV